MDNCIEVGCYRVRVGLGTVAPHYVMKLLVYLV